MQGTFLPSHLFTRVAFKLDASYSLIVASCVIDLNLKVKAFRENTYRCSSLGSRVRVDLVGRDYKWEISEILLLVDLGIWVPRHGIVVFVCTVTSRRVGCGCTVGTFTTLGECGLSLSLGLCSMKTQSSKQEMKNQ